MPGTQGIYGLLVAILIMLKVGLLSGASVALTTQQGAYLLGASLPICLVGIFSAIAQGKTAAAGIMMIAKRPEEIAKGMVFAAMVETYAVFSLLISILLLNSIVL
ncbi:V-type sodium ATPase subunit K [bioreactor metagenome]|uniref:V-type sodium ATPase subunit K n=1 Tax=bioreactor metagenome TaxID=1076179 RepID=A0A645AB01_9ZZZZ